VAEADSVTEAEAICAEEVDVHVSGMAMGVILEVMVLDVVKAVAHFAIAAAE
jgi:hypothetical protein